MKNFVPLVALCALTSVVGQIIDPPSYGLPSVVALNKSSQIQRLVKRSNETSTVKNATFSECTPSSTMSVPLSHVASTSSKPQSSTRSIGSTLTSRPATRSSVSSASVSLSSSTVANSSVTTLSSTTSKSATSTTTSLCPTLYTGKTMIKGTGTLPKPTAFVVKSPTSDGLTLSGKPYRITGPNIYWVCNDENVGLPKGRPTSKKRIREAFAIAVAMGANTVRLTSCGTSVGYPFSIEPARGVWANETYWDVYDYALFAAREYGLRVILPLTDNYDYYHGGKYTFLRWRNVTDAYRGALFYSQPDVVSDFLAYTHRLLTRNNSYTGLPYGRDPTILAWETANELGGYVEADGMYPPTTWTATVSGFIKGFASQLVIDGSNGFYNYTTKEVAPGRTLNTVDIVSDHSYPRNIPLISSEMPLAAAYSKNFLVGEYDWNSDLKDSLDSFLSFIEKNSTTMGSMFWNVMGHDDSCSCYVQHFDGYSMYYPNGNSPAEQQLVLKVVQHQYRMTGRKAPESLPGVACPQPKF